jgi:SAM-dependent methyltransferase
VDPRDVAAAYDRVAEAYAAHFGGELAHKPVDRALLDLIAADARGGRVADLGCGPGHAAAYLAARGARALGVDLSPETIARARAAFPGVEFAVGDLAAPPVAPASLAAAVALYAIVHLTADELPAAFAGIAAALAPGAPLLVSFHVGEEVVRVGELLGVAVDLTFRFHTTAQVIAALESAGLTPEVKLERMPYLAVEHPSTRGYVIARRG